MSEVEKKRVLTVDDSKVALVRLRRLLVDTEFEIAGEARTGADALALFDDLKPDIVLLDIVMPEMDGVAVLRALKERDNRVRVIMVSSMSTEEKIAECARVGARDFVVKPCEQDHLLGVMRQAIAQ